MILMGSIVNAIGIIAGGSVGLLLHKLMQKGIPDRFSDRVMKGLGLCTIYIAFGSLLDGSKPLVTILSMVLGALIGETLDLDGKLNRLSTSLEKKLTKGSSSNGGFAKGFFSATLLFCVGTMAITGSLEGGLLNKHDILYAKSTMDTVAALIFASSLGLGVVFSSVPVFIYQGSIALLASVAKPYLGDAVIAEMNTVGSLLLFALSLDMLGINKNMKLMNYVPAMFMPIILCLFM